MEKEEEGVNNDNNDGDDNDDDDDNIEKRSSRFFPNIVTAPQIVRETRASLPGRVKQIS